MITEALVSLVLKVVSPLIAFLEPLNIVVNTTHIDTAMSFVRGVLYFLPIQTVNLILASIFATWTIRVVISFLKTLWSILPIV